MTAFNNDTHYPQIFTFVTGNYAEEFLNYADQMSAFFKAYTSLSQASFFSSLKLSYRGVSDKLL